eukprot:scaffold73_cov337-Pavlova_lutheri.AAC.77
MRPGCAFERHACRRKCGGTSACRGSHAAGSGRMSHNVSCYVPLPPEKSDGCRKKLIRCTRDGSTQSLKAIQGEVLCNSESKPHVKWRAVE